MTREELANRIQAMCETQAAGTVAAGPAEAVAVALDELFGELATLRATLHPSPAPSMEEVERAIGALCVSIDPAWDDEHDGPLHVAAIGDLMTAIRALPDRYAEGWEAGREAAAKVAVGWSDQYPLDVFQKEGESIEGRAAYHARRVAGFIARDARALPTPTPEADHG